MKHLLSLFLLLSVCVQAQYRISGIIRDEATNHLLPFVTISQPNGIKIVSDVNGKFELNSVSQNTTLTFTYKGYENKEVDLLRNNYLKVKLKPKPNYTDENQLKEGHRLVKHALSKTNQNNPQKALSSFQFKSYNKIIVTAIPDSIIGKIDTIYGLKKNITKVDSSQYKFKKLIQKQHIFLTEKVSLFQFDNQNFKETVQASKMSGFKNPIYEIIGLNLQSNTVYNPKYALLETNYVNPLSELGLVDYDFKILDTLQVAERPTVLVYFKNKKRINRKGLEGLLYLDTENLGIAKAIMRVRGIVDVTAIHDFEYLVDEKIWFPISYDFKIIKGRNDDPIRILGGTIEFEGEYDEMGSKRDKSASDFTFIISKTLFFDREINVPIQIKRNSVSIEIQDDAMKKDTVFWRNNRKIPLTTRDLNTFAVVDSFAYFKGVNSKLFLGRKIINGYVPVGFFDFDLRYLMSYNNYEGFRFGAGGVTNEKLSKKHRLEGYLAYGLKDEAFKYQLGGASRLGEFSNTWSGFSYTDDIQEIGSTKFHIDKRVFKIYDPRPINVSTFYHHQTWRGFVETKFLPKTESIWQLNHSRIEPLFNYAFLNNGVFFTNYTMTTASLSIQWNPFSDYMHTPNGKIEIEKRFPKFTFQFTQSIPKFLDNDFEFGKIDLRAEYEKKFINGQKSAILVQAGFAFGDVPLTHLYNNSPNNLNRDAILQRITVAGKNSFETMYFNEFFSNRFVMLHLKHGFKRIELFKKIKPSLVLVTRMAWGEMENPEQHIGLDYKTINEGFFESGIELNQIYSGFGLAGFYRYGPNQLSRFEDNISLKLTFILDLGL